MRILWISSLFPGFDEKGMRAWQDCLIKHLKYKSDIIIGVVGPTSTISRKTLKDNVSYYPLKQTLKSKFTEVIDRYRNMRSLNECNLASIEFAIENFKPDVIHFWGCEFYYVKLLKTIQIPHVIHIQGIASSYINAYLPPNIGVSDIKRFDSLLNRILKRESLLFGRSLMKKRAADEYEYLKYAQNIIGRTDYDRRTLAILAPNAQYYHCDEIMREVDYNSWKYNQNEKLAIVSTISESLYKGYDLILKTAILLKRMNINLEWTVYGVSENSKILKFFEKQLNVKSDDLDIKCKGIVDINTISESIKNSDVYVHPSYIDNGSNSVSEAQLIGCPVIVQYIGGVTTTCEDNSGILIPANDPFALVDRLLKLKKDRSYAEYIGKNGYERAIKRHEESKITENLINIYKKILE